MEFKDLKNESGLEFTDISSEQFRKYIFATKDGQAHLLIERPIALNVSSSGGHRILTESGYCHYIKPEWISILWQSKEGQPHFVK